MPPSSRSRYWVGWPVSGRVWAARLGSEGTGVSAALSAPGAGEGSASRGRAIQNRLKAMAKAHKA